MSEQERPHKSTTHEEMFFHVFWDPSATARGYKGATVFCRKEDNGYWYGAVAFCAPTDQFSRRVGRSQARRRYFRFSWMIPIAVGGTAASERPTYDLVAKWALEETKATSASSKFSAN